MDPTVTVGREGLFCKNGILLFGPKLATMVPLNEGGLVILQADFYTHICSH